MHIWPEKVSNDERSISENDTEVEGSRTAKETVNESITFPVSKLKCGIICESWPSWLAGVRASNLKCMTVFTGAPGKVKTFFPISKGCSWLHINRISTKILNKLDVLFISGTFPFLINFNKLDVSTMKVVIIEGKQPHRRSLRYFDAYTWERVRHSTCGGVTDSVFWYGWTTERELDPVGSVPKRYLIQALSSSAKSFQAETDVPEKPEQMYDRAIFTNPNTILSTGLLPIANTNVRVVCPSVFTKTKWCERRLTTKEITECFDQDTYVAEACALKNLKVSQMPFKEAVRNEVIQHVLRRLQFSNIKRLECNLDHVSSPVPIITVPPTIESKHLKAVKSDYAGVDTYIWDERVLSNFPDMKYNEDTVIKLNVLRRFLLGTWVRRVWRSFMMYLKDEYGDEWTYLSSKNTQGTELNKNITHFVDCAYRAGGATWFEWEEGSTLFFWRWVKQYRKMARDGIPYWFKGKKTKIKRPQAYEKDINVRIRVTEKLSTVRNKGYIKSGYVKSLIKYFAVPKGEGDVRMVYDGTSSGFNDYLRAPSFGLPTIDSMLRSVDHTTWFGDLDVGEQFLNFQLCEEAQIYCGVNMTPYFLTELKQGCTKIWERWTRCLLGAKPSPYQAIRFMMWAEHMVRGDRRDPNNPFRWSHSTVNLPGSKVYDPSLPWISKLRPDGTLASKFYIYVDDVRVTGPSEEDIWRALRKFSSTISYLGIQDAARKRRPPTTRPGAWAGSMIYIDENNVGVYVDQSKWEKTQNNIKWIRDQIMSCCDVTDFKLTSNYGIDRKELERKRGFLVYVSRTYPSMTPYLKGIHQTLDGWRGGRDEDGSKRVLPATRLEEDITCLEKLFESPYPVVRHVRSKLVTMAYYAFGDALGMGLGSIFQYGSGLRVRHGLWGSDSNKKSSNYRELCNLVEALEAELKAKTILGSEVFIFTDNSVAESCFYKGTSQSRALFNLILRLRKIELEGGLKLQVIHISGARMIAQGTDGLSRFNFLEGVMTGQNILNYVPLHESALDRSKSLLKWLQSWVPDKHLQTLSPEDWYDVGHGIDGGGPNIDGIWTPIYNKRCKLWAPTPAVAFYAMDKLARSRHVDPYTPHMFVCPRSMTFHWRKMLLKYADVVFYINPGSRSFWPHNMFEPLVLGLILPYSKSPPWQLKRSPQVLALESELREVWSSEERDERDILFKFWTV